MALTALCGILKNMLPPYVKKYFWEVDTKKLDPKKRPEYVIARILEYGDMTAVRWMLKTFDKRALIDALKNSREFSSKTANFWGAILGVPKNEILCLKKPYLKTRGKHWPF